MSRYWVRRRPAAERLRYVHLSGPPIRVLGKEGCSRGQGTGCRTPPAQCVATLRPQADSAWSTSAATRSPERTAPSM
jgi:hypothetical protein